jgi:dimethylargininase
VIALTREVSAAIGRCELTHLGREPIDVERARGQHRAYEQALASLGCEIRRVSPAGDLPDSVFIEDTAIVLPEVAVVARPGAASRRPEVAAVVELLGGWRPLVRIDAPGTLDGGDVLVLDRSVFVGRSSRTNDAAIAQLGALLGPYGYRVTTVATPACLHLKSAVTSLTPQAVLLNPAWIAPAVFAGYECIEVDGAEPAAANVVSVGGRLLCAAAYPRTGDRLERRGFGVVRVDVSELAKAEGALTCCSLLVS